MATPEAMLHRLINLHNQQLARLREWDDYYEGEQPLSYMHPELINQLDGQVRQVVINWPQMIVDSLEERLDIEGFRRPEQASGDQTLWDIWEDNDMDAGSQRAHVEALALGRSYVTIGSPDAPGDAPVITDESALDVIAIVDPRTRKVGAALRRWDSDGDAESAQTADMATLYLPNATILYAKDKGGTWVEQSTDKHDLGMVPVVPIANRARRRRPFGASELKLVTPLSDAACKIATDMMVGANYHALPRYFATGVTESDFTDESGRRISVWEAITGRIFAAENEQARIGELAASDLANFHKTLDALAKLVASLCGLPPHYLGFTTDNPASADAIRSSQDRLVKRAERKQSMFDDGWEDVLQIAVRILTGKWDRVLRRMETVWRDASTPTIAQTSDAVVKQYQAGIIPLRFARERLRYSDAEIRQMQEMDVADSAALKVPTAAELIQLRDPTQNVAQPAVAGAAG